MPQFELNKAQAGSHAMSDTFTRSRVPTDVLSQTDFFAVLTPEQLQRVAAISQLQEHPEGVRIYNHGDPATYFYVLADGIVRFVIGFGNRNASAGDILRRGNVFGWAALTPGAKSRIATASCVTRCTVLAIDGDALNDVMEQDTALGFQLMKQLNLLVTGTLAAFAAG
jgi:CRP/FNR family transcriptional regulator, cyclic AMP receptor protein